MRSCEYNTETQQKILFFLKQEKEKAISVNDIMIYLKSQKKNANITTIYRILSKLEKKALIIRHKADNGKKYLFQYIEPASGCHHHLHVQCTVCGKIIHLDCPEIAEMIEHITNEHDIDIICSTSLLYGICLNCKVKK